MKTVKVFPDFLSSGLWLVTDKPYRHINIDESDVSHFVPPVVMIALKYWHHIWEIMVDDDYNSTMSAMYLEQWHDAGEVIVDALNKAAMDAGEDYEFIYCRMGE